MSAAIQRPLAIGLVFSLLALLGPLAAESTSHAAHHAHHHDASVHASALCAWFCAAGQMAQGSHLKPTVITQCGVVTERPCSTTVTAEPLFNSFSRGPPFTDTADRISLKSIVVLHNQRGVYL